MSITNIYGPPSPLHKRTFIESLKAIRDTVVGDQWIIRGDFNLITSLSAKKEAIEG